MRLCPALLGVALVSVALVFGALSASANPQESSADFPAAFERFANTLTTQSARARDMASDLAARVMQDGKEALAAAETDAARQMREFRDALSERKARLGIIGEDAAARIEAWKQDALAALDWFRAWIETPSAPDEPNPIPV